MRLVITAGPPDIWVGLEPETGEEAMALEACDVQGHVDERTRRGHDLNAPRLGGSVRLSCGDHGAPGDPRPATPAS
jgi:hypothetical protein